jgi:hypothetical protein
MKVGHEENYNSMNKIIVGRGGGGGIIVYLRTISHELFLLSG